MKKLLFLLIAANGLLSATAQTDTTTKKQYPNDAMMHNWAIDVNVLGGVLTRGFTTANSIGNYQNALSDANLGNLKFTNGMSYGFDAQLGYFFNDSKHFGIGLGFMYLAQSGDATLDYFHVQYQSTDDLNNVSRQIITANQPVKEALTITNMNIPLVLKYKDRFSKRFGFSADLGVLYNLTIKNSYNTNATFDYEEIVRHVTTSDGTITVYDNSLTPGATDLQITKDHFNNTGHPDGQSIQQYFAGEKALGFNVGLAQAPTHKTGSMSYTRGNLGFIARPAINYYFSDNVALTLGAYLIYQPFNNTPTSNYRLTDKVGDYSSVLNNVTKSNDMSYGGSLGIRILFGGKKTQMAKVMGVSGVDPTACGLTDGSILLTGLTPAKQVTVNYTVDGKTNGTAADMMVQPDGRLKIEKLGAGSYTNISATMGRHQIAGTPVSLTNPPINIYETSTNPSAADACDGTITLAGLKAGQKVKVSYNFNGSPHAPYVGIVGSNNSVILSGLCTGTYTNIVAGVNDCKGNGNDVTLSVPPPPAAATEGNDAKSKQPLADITTPILFEFGKTSIHPSSYPVLEDAILQVGKNDNLYIICEGHTDSRGSAQINETLSFKRAQVVKNYLIKHGVPAEKIVAVGRGSRMPIATNETEEGRAKNRRVVMTLNERSK